MDFIHVLGSNSTDILNQEDLGNDIELNTSVEVTEEQLYSLEQSDIFRVTEDTSVPEVSPSSLYALPLSPISEAAADENASVGNTGYLDTQQYVPELSATYEVFRLTPSPETAVGNTFGNIQFGTQELYQQLYQYQGYQQYVPGISTICAYQQPQQLNQLNVQYEPANFPQNAEVPKRVICRDCGKTFAKKWYYMQHVKAVHTIRPHRCAKCGKKYTTVEELNIHMERHNDKDKLYKCTDCAKRFHYQSDLKRHSIQHSKVSPYVCNVCQKIFTRKDHLVKHRMVHFKE